MDKKQKEFKKLWLNPDISISEIASCLGKSRDYVARLAQRLKFPKRPERGNRIDASLTLEQLRKVAQDKSEEKRTSNQVKSLIDEVERLDKMLKAVQKLEDTTIFDISPKTSSAGGSEATMVVLASDWHMEETVKSDQVSGLNEYNLSIAKARTTQFFQTIKRLHEVFNKDITINTLVLALLGDYISGSIHEDLKEGNSLQPVDAMILAEETIASGIWFLLKHTKLDLVIPCHSGNHGRATEKQRGATEAGNSFEYWMFHHLANKFKDETRVKFLISRGYHSYLNVYNYVVRLHHGHALKYGGGIGGIFVPVLRGIAQWNQGYKADLDCFGHFHQRKDGGNFLCNGSIIGYNDYAVRIKATFEKPSQQCFLIDKRRGRTLTAPILFDR